MKKKNIIIFCILFLCAAYEIYVLFFSLIKIPDLSGVEEEYAKKQISDNNLIPAVVYDYSDKYEKGVVIRTVPKYGKKVEKDSKVTIYVSKGPALIYAENSTIRWYSIDSLSQDEWHFYTPIIQEDDLYITCSITAGTDFTIKSGGFGYASLTDSFEKSVPFTLLGENLGSFENDKFVAKGDTVDFVIKVPLKQLKNERPEHLACKLVYMKDGKQGEIEFSFTMAW